MLKKFGILQKATAWIATFVLISGLFSGMAQAYSYGDPNQEPVADVYKKMAADLNESPPDFAGAKSTFESVKQELDMHMGTEPSAAVLGHLQDKNKDAVQKDMQKVLVLNIARRMESIENDFQNYKQNKTLVAKALATYDALSPIVKQKDPALDDSLRKEFDNALQSLGNPGLFGVGVKQPDPKAFADSRDKILKPLQAQFNLKSLEVGHFAEGPGPGNEQNQNKQAGTDFSNPKNWIPIAVIIIAIAGAVAFARRRSRK